MTSRSRFSGWVSLLVLAGVAAAPSAHAAPSSGAEVAAICLSCHTFHKGEANGVGPNLYGLFGRAAGSASGFNYSAALKASKVRWNAATLNTFLADPPKMLPGERMPISVSDPAQRAALIQYLKAETSK